MFTEKTVKDIVYQVAAESDFVEEGGFVKVGDIRKLVAESIYKVLISPEYQKTLETKAKNEIRDTIYK